MILEVMVQTKGQRSKNEKYEKKYFYDNFLSAQSSVEKTEFLKKSEFRLVVQEVKLAGEKS